MFDFSEGEVLLVDKPLRWTSFQVVNKIRNAIPIRKIKVGHAGTLDPLATGLLIVCTGKMTKQIEGFQNDEKSYEGTFTLGATTPSYDLETEIDTHFDTTHITEEALVTKAKTFEGEVWQTSPGYSALKINGERAYDIARRGEVPAIKARTVHVKEFSVDGRGFPSVSFRITCSKGTYIRSLVHDLGKALDSGAHLTALTRTRIGPYMLRDAWELSKLIASIRQA